jgi:hypothetical protein
MTFDEAISKADEALEAAKNEGMPDSARVNTYLTAANTWVRIAELLNHREANSR